jgi:hypothetical protein
MLQSRSFWLAQGAGIVLFHLVALFLLLTGMTTGLAGTLVTIWAIVLVIHAGELIAAFVALKGMNVPPLTLIAKTLVFGFIWWLPRRLGVYQS